MTKTLKIIITISDKIDLEIHKEGRFVESDFGLTKEQGIKRIKKIFTETN